MTSEQHALALVRQRQAELEVSSFASPPSTFDIYELPADAEALSGDVDEELLSLLRDFKQSSGLRTDAAKELFNSLAGTLASYRQSVRIAERDGRLRADLAALPAFWQGGAPETRMSAVGEYCSELDERGAEAQRSLPQRYDDWEAATQERDRIQDSVPAFARALDRWHGANVELVPLDLAELEQASLPVAPEVDVSDAEVAEEFVTGGGKNGQHAAAEPLIRARKQIAALQDELTRWKSRPMDAERRTAEATISTQLRALRSKAGFRGENHSMKAKGGKH